MASDATTQMLKENTFDKEWVIKKWTNVVQSEALVKNTNTEIKCVEGKLVYASFLVGLKIYRSGPQDIGVIGFYCKQAYKHCCLKNVQALLVVGVLNNTGAEALAYESPVMVENGNNVEMATTFWGFSQVNQAPNWTDHEGSLIIKLKLTLKYFTEEDYFIQQAEFRRTSTDDLSQNLANLINNSLCSDLKIITKENTELFGHKTILCARCPVFNSMFRSEFLETRTGILNVDDISAKTMKLLLTYLYTGELLPSWKDDDTVVEFAYAAGKYQMTQVLKMLDDVLGKDFKAADEDVELLKIVGKLSLKNAEARILKRVVDKVSQTESGVELLQIFSMDHKKISVDDFEVSVVLHSYDDALFEKEDKNAGSEDVKLMILACKLGMKNVEVHLLKRIIRTVIKVGSADELFALFVLENTEQGDDSNLLVRVKPNPESNTPNE